MLYICINNFLCLIAVAAPKLDLPSPFHNFIEGDIFERRIGLLGDCFVQL
jgi:hypothetical protein